jgi:hypothetical protein
MAWEIQKLIDRSKVPRRGGKSARVRDVSFSNRISEKLGKSRKWERAKPCDATWISTISEITDQVGGRISEFSRDLRSVDPISLAGDCQKQEEQGRRRLRALPQGRSGFSDSQERATKSRIRFVTVAARPMIVLRPRQRRPPSGIQPAFPSAVSAGIFPIIARHCTWLGDRPSHSPAHRMPRAKSNPEQWQRAPLSRV